MTPVKQLIAPELVLATVVVLSTMSAWADERPDVVQIVVMDPLALPLSCACVDGVGQRRYDRLVPLLEKAGGCTVNLTYDESLKLASQRIGRTPDMVIGPQSIVLYDAGRLDMPFESVLSLTNREGRTTVRSVLLKSSGNGKKTLRDLRGSRIALPPEEHEECHAAVRRLLNELQLLQDFTITEYGSIEAATFAVTDGEAEAAAVTDFLPPLFEGCGKIASGELETISTTEPVPFVEVFVSRDLDFGIRDQLTSCLRNVRDDTLLDALESKLGFVSTDDGWTDWRGADRAGRFEELPKALPGELPVVWSTAASGPAMAGIAATADFVLVPDKDADLTTDIFRCLDTYTGHPRWQLSYPADDNIDYTNAPRATPVLHNGFAYLQGAGGELHCVEVASGEVVWQRHLLDDFDAEPLPWGCSVPPLVVDDRLIVTPGAKEAAIVALDPRTGAILWETAGHAAAYSPLLVGVFGGKRQIIGYDAAGLAGWDVENGQRLWELIPPAAADFNVTTPVIHDGQLLLATENNGTRLYPFDDDGNIKPMPLATNEDCAPDTCTPVIEHGRVFCAGYGEMFCLDLQDGLKTVWQHRDDLFYDHTNMIAGNGRVLVWTTGGELLLLDATTEDFRVISRQQPFLSEDDVETMSHPAIVDRHLILRCRTKIGCFSLD